MEITELGRQHGVGGALDGLLVLDAEADQVGNGADLEIELLGDEFEVRAPRHGAVVLQDLDNHRRRLQPRAARKIAARLGVAGARQHAAGLRHQRKDVARLDQVGRERVGTHGGLHGARAIGSRDARRDPFRGLDGDGEIGAVRVMRVLHHQRQIELATPVFGERQADQATSVLGHEIDVFRRAVAGSENEVAFVLAILIIHDDDHLAGADVPRSVRGLNSAS